MALNHDRLAKTRARSAGSGWRPKDGKNLVRLLPPHSRYLTDWEALEDIAIAVKIHFLRIEGRPTEVTLCWEDESLGTEKKRCPACAAWRGFRKSEDQALKEMTRNISPSDLHLMNIVDMNNTAQGIQYWSANYTCWDKMLEIAANPSWGNVMSPVDGVDFEVTRTPEGKSRTGFAQYSVMPLPNRTSIAEVLAKVEGWQTVLDGLEDQRPAAKEPAEIIALLEEMGFVVPGGHGKRAPVGTSSPPLARSSVAPRPQVPAAPVEEEEEETDEEEAPPPRGMGSGKKKAAGAKEPHYDPGPDYEPKYPVEEHPPGAPRCFGDYDKTRHRCDPCPVQADCQMKYLGIG